MLLCARRAIVCLALIALLLQLAPLQRHKVFLTSAGALTAVDVPSPECALECTHGGAAEPTATDESLPPLLALLPRSALYVYRWDTEGWSRCVVSSGAILQLPAATTLLPLAFASTLLPAEEVRAVPEGSLLRLHRQVIGPQVGGDEGRCHPQSAEDEHTGTVVHMLSQPHLRCLVPAGALLSMAGTAASAATDMGELVATAMPTAPVAVAASAAASGRPADPPNAEDDLSLCGSTGTPSAPLQQHHFPAVSGVGAPPQRAEWVLTSYAASLNASHARKSVASLLVRLVTSLTHSQLESTLRSLAAEVGEANELHSGAGRGGVGEEERAEGHSRGRDVVAIDIILLSPRNFCEEPAVMRDFVSSGPHSNLRFIRNPRCSQINASSPDPRCSHTNASSPDPRCIQINTSSPDPRCSQTSASSPDPRCSQTNASSPTRASILLPIAIM